MLYLNSVSSTEMDTTTNLPFPVAKLAHENDSVISSVASLRQMTPEPISSDFPEIVQLDLTF